MNMVLELIAGALSFLSGSSTKNNNTAPIAKADTKTLDLLSGKAGITTANLGTDNDPSKTNSSASKASSSGGSSSSSVANARFDASVGTSKVS
jgi:hypothetical protein